MAASFIELLGLHTSVGEQKQFQFVRNADTDRLGCVGFQDELFASLQCQPNFPCTRAELSEDLKSLLQYVSHMCYTVFDPTALCPQESVSVRHVVSLSTCTFRM